MNENLRKILDWVVWAKLDEYTNTELLLLKGHLILEVLMDELLYCAESCSNQNVSFHRKVKLISEVIGGRDSGDGIVQALLNLNKIRNKFAHEWQFSLESSGLDAWANEVLTLFPVVQFTNYTYRTKLVHAFAALARALAESEIGTEKSGSDFS